MSLVDYASSSEDEDAAPSPTPTATAVVKEDHGKVKDEDNFPPQHHRSSTPSLHRQSTASQLLIPKIEKLPDASLLLGSSAFSSQQLSNRDHFSRVSVGMTVSASSRKRELSGSVSSFSCNKYPRGTVPTSQNVSDTMDSLLVPPQLSGRSNVVTEDIGKLFVKRGAHRSLP